MLKAYMNPNKQVKQKKEKEKNHHILSCLVYLRFMICKHHGNSDKEEITFNWKYLE